MLPIKLRENWKKVRMANKKIGEFEKLAEFLADDPEALSPLVGKDRLKQTIKMQLQRLKMSKSQSWIAEAAAERNDFNSSTKGLIEKLSKEFGSRSELLAAIKNGKFGVGPTNQYQVQYRNRSIDQLSDDDLLSLIGDQVALELLKKNKENK